MFAFHDPAEVASIQDECMWNIATVLTPKTYNDRHFDRDSGEVLAHTIWYLPVSIQPFTKCNVTQRPIKAGSSSLHSTMNGESFVAIAPTGGQYGSVVINASTSFYHTAVTAVLS
jgi:hypothetical protein